MDTLIAVLRKRGEAVRLLVTGAGYTVSVLLHSVGRVLPDLVHRRRFVRDQLVVCGVSPLPVVAVVGLFTGMILSLQVGVELGKYGQSERVSDIIGIVLFREMGPFMSAMILTASVGSAMAAELGTMAVSEEIDALECLSIDVYSFLTMPRLLGLMIMAPILTFVGNVVGVIGGGIVCSTQLDIPFSVYMRNVRLSLEASPGFFGLPDDIYTGLVKAVVFGALIATISCAAGLRAHGGALGVGRAVRSSVVSCFLMIMIIGYYLSWVFYR